MNFGTPQSSIQKASFQLDDGSLDITVTAMALLCIARFAVAISPTIKDGNAVPKRVGIAAKSALVHARRIVVR